MNRKILVIFGTRPEIIKLAPVIHALDRARAGKIEICDAGQHPHLAGPLLQWFGIHVHHRLKLMGRNQSLARLSSRAFISIERLMLKAKPDLVLCQGDTTTAMIAGLVAYYQRVPLVHVEAGLRTGDRFHPYPEEVNRRILSLIADVHFAPTQNAACNLKMEKIPLSKIKVTGNTSIDALLWTIQRFKHCPLEVRETDPKLRFLFKNGVEKSDFVIVTAHRRESFGVGIRNIALAVKELAHRYPKWKWVVPLHPNPDAGPVFARILKSVSNVILCRPLSYPQLCLLLDRCRFVITDSGGIQEEAPAIGKPVIVVREKTERPEAMETGHLLLAGLESSRIVRAAKKWMDSPLLLKRLSHPTFPYGDGKSSTRIVSVVKRMLREM